MQVSAGEYLTVENMAERLGKNKEAVKKLLQNAGFRPLSRDALIIFRFLT